jgi:RNA polymerase sigma factor (sigma-70 family)
LLRELTDDALRALVTEDPERGWRAFVDQYTPTLLALISRAGVVDRDDAGEVYVRICGRLAADRCSRLRRHDPAKGALAAWLTILVRHAVVDWVRSRSGRRRLFGAIRSLPALDQRVFQLFYWDRQRAPQILEALRSEQQYALELADVLDALERIQRAMSDRHRADLLCLIARNSPPSSLDAASASEPRSEAPGDDPEHHLRVKEINAHFAAALAELPIEDAAIIRLTFVQGWSRHQVQRALHLDQLSPERMRRLLATLRELLAARRLGPRDAATPGLSFLNGGIG